MSPGLTSSLPALLGEDGGVTIVDFIYTHCETVCLTLGSSFQQLQAALQADREAGQSPKVRLLSISFDGARDDPAALQAYAQGLRADPSLWRFDRVPDVGEQQALLRALGVVVIPDGRGDYEHNAALLVFDARGRMVRVFDLAEQQLALDYARHLAARASTRTCCERTRPGPRRRGPAGSAGCCARAPRHGSRHVAPHDAAVSAVDGGRRAAGGGLTGAHARLSRAATRMVSPGCWGWRWRWRC